MEDPAFRELAAREHLDIDYVSGEKVAGIIAKAYAAPAEVIASARELMSGGE
jgi:hypothetical protein